MHTLFPLLSISAALAQDAGDARIPEMNAQLYRVPVDADMTLWADDSAVGRTGWFGARAGLMYVRDPLVFVAEDAEGTVTQEARVLSDAVQADAIVGFALSRLRVGVDVPVFFRTSSELLDEGAQTTGLGDLALDLKANVANGAKNPLGLAFGARLAFPTASPVTSVGNSGTGWLVQAIVDKRWKNVLLAGNLGTQGAPEAVLGDQVWKNQFVFRTGLGIAVDKSSGFSADLAGHLDYDGMFEESDTQPVELLVGGWTKVAGDFYLRGGVGTGLVQAVGAPSFRTVAVLSYDPPRDFDPNDRCPDEAEDVDGFQDDDGCPDPLVDVHLLVQDTEGNPVTTVRTTVETGPEGKEIGGHDMYMKMHPGRYAMFAEADGYRKLDTSLTVPENVERHEVVKVMERDALPTRLRINVVDAKSGASLNATCTIDAESPFKADNGVGQVDVKPGTRTVNVSHEGYKPATVVAEVPAGVVTEVLVPLERALAEPKGDEIVIMEPVKFVFNKTEIIPESYPVLNAVVDVMRAHPEILKVRIEGHTDSRGSAAYNQDLSNRRAAAVLQYLVDHGIDRGRLTSAGYGESRRKVGTGKDSDDEATVHQINRRVEFIILERSK